MKTLKFLIVGLIALVCVGMFAGCATGHEAYSAAHESQAKRGIAEAQAKQKSDETIALAIASAAKTCESDACRMGAMMTYANIKASATGVVQSAATAIAAPVNDVLEGAKFVVKTAVDLYSLRVGAAIKLGDMSRGAADKDVMLEGLSSLDIYRNKQAP
jgi:hypothetical protein